MDGFLAQLADARSSKVREYVAVTRGMADSLSLPAYLAAIPQRSRRRALTQQRCGSHWLAEETAAGCGCSATTACALIAERRALAMWRMLRTPSCTAPGQPSQV